MTQSSRNERCNGSGPGSAFWQRRSKNRGQRHESNKNESLRPPKRPRLSRILQKRASDWHRSVHQPASVNKPSRRQKSSRMSEDTPTGKCFRRSRKMGCPRRGISSGFTPMTITKVWEEKWSEASARICATSEASIPSST